jgi:hypothetical protein
MYYEDGEKIVGVLNDFDLASTEDSVTATQRTGTVPFMAVDLLTVEGILGEVRHLYEHDAQSFIWVLVWVSLQYEGGKLHGRHPELDEWQKDDPVRCGVMKSGFLLLGSWRKLLSGKGHEGNWKLAKKGIIALRTLAISKSDSGGSLTLDIDAAFEKLLMKLDPYAQMS